MSSLNLKVLIVEPNAGKSSALAETLEKLGNKHCQQTQHFRNITKILGTPAFDVVFLGDDFVDATTEEALRFLKHHPELKNLPVLWYTSDANPSRVRELIGQGIVDVISYPIEISQLQSALRNYFRIVNTREILKLIRKASFFSEFTADELQTLVKVAIPRRFQAGETIITKGDPADKFYVLLKGKVEVLSLGSCNIPQNILIHEGTPFGDMAIVDHSPRSAFCIAADDSLVLEIGSHIMNDVTYALRSRVLASLAFTMTHRLRKMNLLLQQLQEKYDILATQCAGGLAPGQQPVIPVPPALHIPPKEKAENSGSLPTFDPTPTTAPHTATAPTKKPREASTAVPMADSCTLAIRSQEEYDVLQRKVALRFEFISSRIPEKTKDVICNKLTGYWTSNKLARYNPHHWWNPDSFIPGTHTLKQALHLVVFAPKGEEAFNRCFLGLPLTHRVVSPPQVGCMGTFLGTDEAIRRYLEGHWLKSAIHLDLEMPIERGTEENKTIEFLTHTTEDVRDQTLFLIFDQDDGQYTRLVRDRFPNQQIVTVVSGIDFNTENLSTLFTAPEEKLSDRGLLTPKDEYSGKGFYSGQTFLLPDLSAYYWNTDALNQWGYLFGTIGVIAKVGPDYSGITWGSRGGAEGALRASRALYGQNFRATPQEISRAISWADQ